MTHPLHPTDPTFRVCADCTYPFDAKLEACPNPACYPGMGADNAKRAARLRERDEWVQAKQRMAASNGTFYMTGALQEMWERAHPLASD